MTGKKDIEKKPSSAKAIEAKEKQLEKELEKTKKLQNRLKSEASKFRKQFAKRTLALMTSGFGLVSALAWNELIKELVKEYVKPFFGESSGLISLTIYAVFITALAVLVTYQLSKLAGKEAD